MVDTKVVTREVSKVSFHPQSTQTSYATLLSYIFNYTTRLIFSLFQLSVIAMLAAQTTEESLLKKAVKIVVLMEPTIAVDEAIDEVVDVSSIDIAQLLEGEDVLQLSRVQIC